MYLIYKKSCLLDISTLKEVQNLSFCWFCFLMSNFVFCRMIIIQSFVLNLRELIKLHVLSYMILIQNLRVVSAIERVPEPTWARKESFTNYANFYFPFLFRPGRAGLIEKLPSLKKTTSSFITIEFHQPTTWRPLVERRLLSLYRRLNRLRPILWTCFPSWCPWRSTMHCKRTNLAKGR